MKSFIKVFLLLIITSFALSISLIAKEFPESKAKKKNISLRHPTINNPRTHPSDVTNETRISEFNENRCSDCDTPVNEDVPSETSDSNSADTISENGTLENIEPVVVVTLAICEDPDADCTDDTIVIDDSAAKKPIKTSKLIKFSKAKCAECSNGAIIIVDNSDNIEKALEIYETGHIFARNEGTGPENGSPIADSDVVIEKR
jgi:hypothetical protein